MSISADGLEKLFQEKIMLYHDMASCLKNEQTSLMETDVDALWKYSEKKQALVNQIEDTRAQALAILAEAGIDHRMDRTSFSVSKILNLIPPDIGKKVKKFEIPLVIGKKSVQSLVSQNKAYVDEYLQVIDDLMETLTSVHKSQTGYDKNRYPESNNKTSLLLHWEV